MPWISGGTEYIDLPTGETPVEVKMVQLLQLADESWTSDDKWPPPTRKADENTEPDTIIGFRLLFGVYGNLEEAWKKKAKADDNARVSWASPWPILSLPFNAATEKFLKPWENNIAPALGGMADGFLREHVKNLGTTPTPVFYKAVLEGMRCIATIVTSTGRDGRVYFNVNTLKPDSEQADHNLALVRQRVEGKKPTLDNEVLTELTGLVVALRDLGEKNDTVIGEDCEAVSKGRVSRIENLQEDEARELIVEYTELWNAAETAMNKITKDQKTYLEGLFGRLTTAGIKDTDGIVADVKKIMGPDADKRKGTRKYLDVMTQAEASELITLWEDLVAEPVAEAGEEPPF